MPSRKPKERSQTKVKAVSKKVNVHGKGVGALDDHLRSRADSARHCPIREEELEAGCGQIL